MKNDQDIKAAAERVLQPVMTSLDGGATWGVTAQYYEDAHAVARAYLDRLATLGPCGYSPTFTADELHTRIIDDLRAYCAYHERRDVTNRYLDDHLSRPLEQTICGVISMMTERKEPQ